MTAGGTFLIKPTGSTDADLQVQYQQGVPRSTNHSAQQLTISLDTGA